MKTRQLKEYSNAADFDVSKIPQHDINDFADILYEIYVRSTENTTKGRENTA